LTSRRAPFTVSNLKKILRESVLKRQAMPDEQRIMELAEVLNHVHSAFCFHNESRSASIFRRRRTQNVIDAIHILICFFDLRNQDCRNLRAGVVIRERKLRQAFYDFVKAFRGHTFELPMDADPTALMPDLKGWRSIAEVVASAFTVAMHPTKIGHSNTGPIPRFVAAVLPLLTGETPSIGNVAQHLKKAARARRVVNRDN
jgi:hypothetical protein